MLFGATKQTATKIENLLQSRHLDPLSSLPSTGPREKTGAIILVPQQDVRSPRAGDVDFPKVPAKIKRWNSFTKKEELSADTVMLNQIWHDNSYTVNSQVECQRSVGGMYVPSQPVGRTAYFQMTSTFINSACQAHPVANTGWLVTNGGYNITYTIYDYLGVFLAATVGTKLIASYQAGYWMCIQMECPTE